ncbi:hypothetical protein [Brevibacterium sediminis]|uniref:hypothetical protein n=1 Tax=Brevibacterium sediminis TaxID=1857024 RepID=UPI00366CB62E
MTSEPYVPPKIGFVRADMHAGDGMWKRLTETEFDRLIARVKADAVRGFAHEVQRGLDREHHQLDQDELSTRITLIAEADAYAQRIEEEP